MENFANGSSGFPEIAIRKHSLRQTTRRENKTGRRRLVGGDGLEPPTFSV
jgi:hypothetical protein